VPTPYRLGAQTIGALRRGGEELVFAPGEGIVRRGEKAEWLYVVVSGEVEIAIQDGEAPRRTLARLGAGATFGAEAALAGQASTVDATALDEVRVLRYPAGSLPTALEESASLRRKLFQGLAHQYREATSDVLGLLRSTDVIARLAQGDDEVSGLVAVSSRMRNVVKRLDLAAARRDPLLLVGEAGTGRTVAARRVHHGSGYAEGSLIAVSCAKLAPGRASALILGRDDPEGGDGHPGGIDLARGGTLLLRDVDALDEAVQQRLARCLADPASPVGGAVPQTRLVATAGAPGNAAGSRPSLDPELLACFEQVVDLPRLASRPRDVLPLADAFLARHGDPEAAFDEGARHALLSMPYRRANVAELREVVDLAVRVAAGPMIRAEHILTGLGDADAIGLDLTDSAPLRRLTRGRLLSAIKTATAVGFLAVIALCLTAATTTPAQLANGAIWSLWEPLVFASFLLAGPVWCTVCPLSSVGRAAQRAGSLGRPPPAWVRRHGPWLAVAGFALIVWSERVFAMTVQPLGSGVLLLALLAAAVVCGLIYSRELWCRHLCPLGRLGVALAPAAPLELGARRSVCASACEGHECYRGDGEIPGCTVHHHPLKTREAHRCKLCLDCLRSCPHSSARLQLRPPLRGVATLESSAADLGMFSLAVAALAAVLLLPVASPEAGRPFAFTWLCVAAVCAGLLGHRLLVGQPPENDARHALRVRVAAASMILGWGALMVSQLENLPLLGRLDLVVRTGPGWLPAQLPGLLIAQLGVLAAAWLLATLALRRIRAAAAATESLSPVAWAGAHLAFLGYAAAAAVVVILR
jgi:transcriptional regulator with AAA-type ATPase domain